MTETKHTFTKEEIEAEIKRYKDKGLDKTAEQVIEAWAYKQYPLKWGCGYYIKKIGKTYIIIGEID